MSRQSLQQNKHFSSLVINIHSLFDSLREVTGDAAYEKYLHHCRQHHPEIMPLDRKAFYDQRMQQKWSGISRCC